MQNRWRVMIAVAQSIWPSAFTASGRIMRRRWVSVGAMHAAPAAGVPPHIAPVEYAVAVDRYLAAARLGQASRRIYKISLTSWCWPLIGQRPPVGRFRRGAVPPVVPLALLDDAGAGPRLATAVADRAALTDAGTVNRELSALRSAVNWWQDQEWISSDPTAGLRHVYRDVAALPPLTSEQLAALWRSDARIREHAFWRLLYDSGGQVTALLALDATDVDLDRNGPKPAARPLVGGRAETPGLLGCLTAGRKAEPEFRTRRRRRLRAVGSGSLPTGR